MKRDMDLVRTILLAVEAIPDESMGQFVNRIDRVDSGVFARHVEIMLEAGLVEGHVVHAGRSIRANVNGITWDGYEFLDSIRSDTAWAKTKARIAGTVGSASFEVIKAVAVSYAMRAVLG